jgi:SAM-dependent methyltransferase
MAASDDIARRLALLPAERRALLERMLKQQAAAQAPRRKPPAPLAQERLTLEIAAGGNEQKAGYRRFYDQVSRQLDSSEYGSFSTFLNYGYAANEDKQYAQVDLPEHHLNRNSVKLVLELVGAHELSGQDILDVGCGRGGTITTLDNYFAPGTLTGIDISAEAIAFDRRTYTDPRLSFHEGDAENLPFDDRSFDVVTNVESSHTYPDLARFYGEAFRVLKTPGWFLYTDLLPAETWETSRSALTALGFVITHDRDISANVLLSCDQIARNRVGAFATGNDAGLMRDFLAAPGSTVYQSIADSSWHYRILWCRKGKSSGA